MRERPLETLTSAGQRGHHSANGDGSNASNFLIRAAFEFAKDEDFAEAGGQSFEGAREALAVRSSDGQGLRRGAGLRMQFFVEFSHEFHRAILLQPGIASIAHNLQKPGARVATVETAEKAVGTEHGLLGDVFTVSAAFQKPAR